ncbi:MAG: hypothetical protein M3498_14535 [Deinococcota bacterium]|nr:hypothetical protein [Deinococcota bacterium]
MVTLLQLLGPPRVSAQGRWCDVPLTKPSLLLFYLAYCGDWVSREELAFFFRPDADEATGRHYVRKLLSGAKGLPWVQGLEVEPKRLRWRVDTDVARLRAALDEGCWERAVKLYRGPLLSGVSAAGTPGFEAWLELEREDLEASRQRAGLHYAADLEAAGAHHQAAAVAKSLIRDNPMAEDALQSFMRNACLCGRREPALRAYHAFALELQRELGLAPLEATSALAERIRRARALPPEPAVPEVRAGPEETGEDPELSELLGLLTEPDTRLLTLAAADGGGEHALIVARRVPDVTVALAAVAALAARMAGQGHLRRSLELALLALGHPACDEAVRARLDGLWPLLEPHFPQLSAEARRRWRDDEGRDEALADLLDLVNERG